MNKITIKDVARASGTSVRTVSRVINNDPHVKEETRRKVQEVIEQLGYVVNPIARSLREKKTNMIVVFVDRHQGLYWGAFHNEIIQELHRLTRAKGYRMMISSSSADSFAEDENDGFYFLKNGLFDGAIMFDTKQGDQRITYLKEHKIPFVILGKDKSNYDTPYVDLDNEYAGYLGAQYLYERGRRCPALLLGDANFIVNQERAAGFTKFTREKGLSCDTVYFGITDMGSAYRQTLKLIEQVKELDAIFISGDERGLGVYRAIQEKGLSIPHDIAVLGIDNVRLSEYLYPPLTTIDQPKQAFSQSAWDILVEQMEQGSGSVKRIILTPTIVERQSV
ncbi:DNA-binding LacI/PurR family transcriptional regulator [Caldalkalibacillus uzonensis]|uniref:DNA-binding LacI/PurR family transcriptional regulator n=1 Tax=Caldalkalibacillus uzonensis TaxID=353224 RepID=A0ABU0CQQ9_9BACI|nr:LacI family DNA-binding transcriptional regulator [Caldalkalibacillus uzonensis]MDQ0338755.1 DNA-binding LacI/PurR family transcriptional regulator [Caldalkalibacillus uzonensis]